MRDEIVEKILKEMKIMEAVDVDQYKAEVFTKKLLAFAEKLNKDVTKGSKSDLKASVILKQIKDFVAKLDKN